MTRSFDITPKLKNSPNHNPSKKNNGLVNFFYLGTVIFLFIIIANLSTPRNQSTKDLSTSQPTNIRPTALETTVKSATSTPSPSATQNQPSDQATVTPTPQDSINKSTIKIKLLNGAGKSGLAQTTKSELEAKGFTITAVGTAQNLYSQTTIYYNENKLSEAQLLKNNLSNNSIIIQQNNQLTASYDLLLVLGAK